MARVVFCGDTYGRWTAVLRQDETTDSQVPLAVGFGDSRNDACDDLRCHWALVKAECDAAIANAERELGEG